MKVHLDDQFMWDWLGAAVSEKQVGFATASSIWLQNDEVRYGARWHARRAGASLNFSSRRVRR